MSLTIDNPTIKPIRDKLKFSVYIERYALENEVSLMTALLQYCEDVDLDVDKITKYISDSLKSKLEEEAVQDHYMIRHATTLPIDD